MGTRWAMSAAILAVAASIVAAQTCTGPETAACKPNPCKPDADGKGQCVCPDGYTCEHGVCKLDATNKAYCDCTGTGYDGPACAHNIDDCVSIICQHGGSCVDGIKTYTCECSTGWTGPMCADTDYCGTTGKGKCVNGATCL